MKIDLGCGSHPRGDVGVDSGAGAVCTATTGDDPFLEPLGFSFNPNARLVKDTIEHYLEVSPPTESDDVLIAHTLEHLHDPYSTLEKLRGAHLVVVVVPNPLRNNADCVDEGHLFSWTPCALRNLLSQVFERRVEVRPIVWDLDLLAVVHPLEGRLKNDQLQQGL